MFYWTRGENVWVHNGTGMSQSLWVAIGANMRGRLLVIQSKKGGSELNFYP